MLRSSSLCLVPLCEADMPDLFEWINSREGVLYNAPYKPISELQHRAWFESLAKKENFYIFGIRLLEGDKLIGSCQLGNVNPTHRNAGLQIRIGVSPQRGKGYGREAVNLLLKFAFADLNLHRVSLEVFATNERAIAVYAKAGFQREGVMKQAAFIDGHYVDIVAMGILASQWQEKA